MTTTIELAGDIPCELAGKRLDAVLAQMFPDYSRGRIQQWIEAGAVEVAGVQPRLRQKVNGGESVRIHATLDLPGRDVAEDLPLDLVHEDEHLLVINKPAGLVVHPAAGHPQGTLVNALLHHAPELAHLPRAGIVHRLDKDTSGLLVVARTLAAHTDLVRQLQARTVGRQYLALVQGTLVAGGTIDAPIGRHPVDRKRMAVTPGGREAITHYRVDTRFPCHTLLRVNLETGRTHQIRVHLAHRHHPIVGDPVYGGRLRRPGGLSDRAGKVLQDFRRQALHATCLTLDHPDGSGSHQWQCDPPQDMQTLLAALGED
ncbi:23S rRNA pseudouridine1911/1915/1917 synthase [Ectothiorhodospira magna]|uniref:Pseudouridine synthase n=1 Tax=Ectothiorhodospira magna TaxID=867345 RepID=A0A1H8ZBQ8_9GAMM|nr:23S rRNA pseudouridine(1911/1915/1917) synthase RluD [Ectothiorhodospira magna]SEP61058.1 23S rRNA pseudouridine1911/1915/1917 synthase [Ectothiorhodospira magna]